jgi:hypothetical protein
VLRERLVTHLLDGKLEPITSEFGFIEANAEKPGCAGDVVEAWRGVDDATRASVVEGGRRRCE